MSATIALLLSHVRSVLQRAGFFLVDAADDVTPGMRVSAIPSGVRVHWTALGGKCTAHMGPESPRGSIVRAAVTAVLADHRLCVMSSGAADDLIVLPSDQIHFRPRTTPRAGEHGREHADDLGAAADDGHGTAGGVHCAGMSGCFER
ncbi:hypothetical protein [Streptomyces sp. NPDC000229]|uniref:hypothetical protein n=1 Tax=Streptomyces sp. NPDC000229 TaxID=3154247 RepID=UPI00332AD9E8